MAKNTPVREILEYTEEQLTMESNILVDNVAKNFPVRVLFQNTEEHFMKE